ncbi:subtilisin-like protein [Aulographum hederae CBS 113979]|uniref:Subtilisin-like protein n=1 Tax=Aulographum hederae CBS 113979 TaxID=1176131 RepID=A0A6G1HF36_9PEZI|nr:subtilisin-like protein [Aulographum hederae CBS 113979]
MDDVLSKYSAGSRQLFGKTSEDVRKRQLDSNMNARHPVDLSRFRHIDAPVDSMEDLAAELRLLDAVSAAYIRPGAAAAIYSIPKPAKKSKRQTNATTPNFRNNQGYLDAAPAGIDIKFARTYVGGDGAAVKVADVEWGWHFTHEDLKENASGVISGTNDNSDDAHGTAVAGEISGDSNKFGIEGIAPGSQFMASAISGDITIAEAITNAADALSKGDVLLIEVHIGGPESTGNGQEGYIAVEWWPEMFDAIRYAVNKGVVVVEAAGNGAVDFDRPIYGQEGREAAGFPSDSLNPFDMSNPQSGAIIVGAGAPPPGTHGADYGADRSRLDFSNWGARVDVQAWGREVTSTGYGDLLSGDENSWYTDTFSGTSSASPIVVGAVAVAQSIRVQSGRSPLTGEQFAQLFRQTGSAQQDGPNGDASQRIGNRPDLSQLVPAALDVASEGN